MNDSIVNIIDYVVENYEYLNTIEKCQVLINKYDIEINDEIVDYIEENDFDYWLNKRTKKYVTNENN